MAAPGKFSIALTGDTQLIAVFETLDVQVQRKALAPSLRHLANIVERQAVQNAPMRQVRVHTSGRLGIPAILGGGKRGPGRLRAIKRIAQHFARLRNNFNVKALKRRRTRVGFSVWTGTRAQLGITSKYYYPAHVEWGHALVKGFRVGTRRLRTPIGRVKPYPYLGPAYHRQKQALLSQFASDVRQRIQTITGVVVPP